jgi:hypothetical protein
MSACLSAIGAKRTWRGHQWFIDRTLMTHSGHEWPLFAAMHATDHSRPAILQCVILALGYAP